MSKIPEDKTREERTTMEIIVDAYGPEEQAMGGIVTFMKTFISLSEVDALKEHAHRP